MAVEQRAEAAMFEGVCAWRRPRITGLRPNTTRLPPVAPHQPRPWHCVAAQMAQRVRRGRCSGASTNASTTPMQATVDRALAKMAASDGLLDDDGTPFAVA
jgi:hypothetical protein